METAAFKERINLLIAGDQLNEAAEDLAEYWKENNEPLAALSLAQLRRLKTLRTQQTKGTLSDNDAFVERAKITDALLSICAQVGASKPVVPEELRGLVRPDQPGYSRMLMLVMGAVVVVAGIFIFRVLSGEPQPGAFTLSLGFHEAGEAGKIIREGRVKIMLGDRDLGERQIDGEGKIHYENIPTIALADSIRVIPVGMPYQVARQSAYFPEQSRSITVELAPVQQTIRWRGTVINGRRQPVANAVVDVESGLAGGKTDDLGNFVIEVPKKAEEQYQVTVMVDGRMVRNASYVLSEIVPVTIVLDKE